jgi:hypothetical protein
VGQHRAVSVCVCVCVGIDGDVPSRPLTRHPPPDTHTPLTPLPVARPPPPPPTHPRREEIFTFTQRYGNSIGASAWSTSNLTFAAVKAYTPSAPHWAYHGASRRYWDFEVNGKFAAGPTERALHHYGSGINSIVLLGGYRRFPNETVALRTGFAASWGAVAAIDAVTGSPHMGFHGDASSLVWEPYAADFGVNLFGAVEGGWGCFVDADADLGWTGYGCDVLPAAAPASSVSASAYSLLPYDPHRRQIYLGPLGIHAELRSSALANATVDLVARTLTLVFDHAYVPGGGGGTVPGCPGVYAAVRLVLDVPTHASQTVVRNITVQTPSNPPLVRGAYELPCGVASAVVSWVDA